MVDDGLYVGGVWDHRWMEFIAGTTGMRLTAAAFEDLRQLGTHTTIEELQEAFRSRVRKDVALLADQMASADAFDLIELMRLREVPIAPVLGLAPNFEGSAAALEMITLVLTSRGSRQPPDPGRVGSPYPHELISGLHDSAVQLLRLTTIFLMASARFSDNPLANLAAEYQGNVVNIRAMQYSHIQEDLNTALFANEQMNLLLEDALGFNYLQFVEVRDAVGDLYSDRVIALRDETAEIVQKYDVNSVPDDVAEQFEQAMVAMMFLPGARAQFTAADLSDRTSCDEEIIKRMLEKFSIRFTQRDPADVVLAFLRGDNPLRAASLVSDDNGHYLIAGSPIGTDGLRHIIEEALKTGPKWKTYDKVRCAVSESLALKMVANLLRTEPRFEGLKYYAPKDEIDPSSLGSECANLTEIADETECDGFFVVDDVALCIEVKGRSVAEQARRGDVRRLARELSSIVGSAAHQARRLETLVETNGGIWTAERAWLDLRFLREVRSIAVCLDDFGPLGIAMNDLRRAEILKDDKLPWITSLHDLSVLAEVLVRPAEFLLYVRRRSDLGVARLYRATDELDLFMLFMSGQLYVEPDPEQVSRDHPMVPRPTKAARRRFRQSQKLTRVGTHTDPLDAWMYWKEGSNPDEAPKPEFIANPFVLSLVDELTRLRDNGWLRTTTDLLAISGDSQRQLEQAIKSVIRSTQIDHRPHRVMQAFAGVWGLPMIVAGSCPLGTLADQALMIHEQYTIAKKHQLQSDRATCILIDETGHICDVRYDNRPPGHDPDLDNLAQKLGQRPPRK
ncbi:hypothetical protein ACIBQ0_39185 [Nocardia nova]